MLADLLSARNTKYHPFENDYRGVYTTEQKWHGSDKNWNGSKSFCKETVKSYPFRNWSIGACGPDTERIKLHCFFAKTIGTVSVFVGSVPFLLCRVNAPYLSTVSNLLGAASVTKTIGFGRLGIRKS